MKRAVPGQPAARQREPADENLLDGQFCIQSIAHVAADIGPEHTILLSQVVNHILVLAIDPDRQNGVGPRFCATAPKTRGRHSRAAAVSPNGGGRRATAEERHSREPARDEP